MILFSNLYRFSNFCSGLSSKEPWHILGRSYAQIPADLAIFAPAEVAAIDDIIDVFKGVSAATASEISHSELGWQIAGTMEEIPPYTYLLSEGDLTEEDIEWAKGCIEEHRASAVR